MESPYPFGFLTYTETASTVPVTTEQWPPAHTWTGVTR